jgi:dihydrofolate synthase/folylpolyglutamate synthase
MTSSVDAHLAALYRLRRFGIKFGLTAITRLLNGLQNPQDRFPSVHISGSNGKGSTAAILSSILQHGGFKVGLYTSPHLIRFNERIQINGTPIPDDDLAAALEAVRTIYTQGDPPTFFECATAMAFYYFAAKEVDWAVIETGMGGRYDATNVVRPEACIISNISMEHQAYLGNTLAEIAREKAGIIKQGVGVVTGVRQKAALHVIEKIANRRGAALYRLGKEIRTRKNAGGTFTYFGIHRRWPRVTVGLAGVHQYANAALALGAAELLQEKGVRLSDQAVYEGLARTSWGGRLEVAGKRPLVLLDGAHNPSAMKTLRKFLESPSVSGRLILVVGILEDKDWKSMLREVSTMADRIILTRPVCDRAADPHELASFARLLGQEPRVVPHLPDALSLALEEAGPDDTVCITGSLYTVGDAKACLQGSHTGR